MKLEIVEVKNAFWTEMHARHMMKYGGTSYGLHLSEAQYLQELENIRNGNPRPRCEGGCRVFEIRRKDDGKLIGDIVLITDTFMEIEAVVFDEFAGKGAATWAISAVLAILQKEGLKAVNACVQKSSPDLKKVLGLFGGLGFVSLRECSKTIMMQKEL